jgi:tRNA U34 2-thiouridine synthase MnmA/TrmU
MNPCIDCRIFILKKAKEYAEKIGAKFIFTGEVLNERPMSQHEGALRIIEKEAGLKGKILRPLSAKLLPETEAEKKAWVDRTKLLEINGRSRKPQIKLAKEFGIADYPCPAGGCLLTEKDFANKVRDFFKHNKKATVKDMEMLKSGRHFRIDEGKIIVGRNETENNALEKLRKKTDYVFEVKDIGSPITILCGKKTKKSIRIAAELTARYSDAEDGEVNVSYGKKSIVVSKPLAYDEAEFRI